jgi:chromosome segregation ATPase
MSADKELPVVAWQYMHKKTGRAATVSKQVDMSIHGGTDYVEHELCSKDPASARIAELEHEAQQLSALVQALDAKAAELEQQLEQARRDAERYRWLRDKAREVDWAQIGSMPADKPAAIDAEIDSAIASQGTAQEVGK